MGHALLLTPIGLAGVRSRSGQEELGGRWEVWQEERNGGWEVDLVGKFRWQVR